MSYNRSMTTPRTFTISLPSPMAREVDRLALAEGRSRSELFREAIRQYIERKARWEAIFAVGERIAKAKNLTEAQVTRIVEDERRSSGR